MPNKDTPTPAPTPTGPSTPVAIIPSPFPVQKEEDRKLIAFSTNTDRNLTLQKRPYVYQTEPRIYSKEPGVVIDPVLTDKSSIFSIFHQQTLAVFGVTGNPGDYRASLVSPVFEPQGKVQPLTTAITGHTFPATKAPEAWLYYYGLKPKSTEKTILQYKIDLDTSDQRNGVPMTVNVVHEDTRLACTQWKGQIRYVAYQMTNGKIVVANSKFTQNDIVEHSASDATKAKMGTPISIVVRESADGTKAFSHIYWLNEDNYVCTVQTEVDATGQLQGVSKVKPEKVVDIENEIPDTYIQVEDLTDFNVIPFSQREGGASNLLFYVSPEGKGGLAQLPVTPWV